MSKPSGWNDRFAIDKSGNAAGSKPVRRKKFIAMNGSEVKATIDTGPSKLRKKIKQKPTQKAKIAVGAPVQSKTKHMTRQLSIDVTKEDIMSPVVHMERPYTLPILENHPTNSLDIIVPENILRSQTGDACNKPRNLPITQSVGSLEIDVSGTENITAKEKRQWREFSTLTEDQQSDSSAVVDLVRLTSIGKGSSAYVYKSVLFPSLRVVADKVVVISNKEKSSQLVRELKSLRAAVLGSSAGGSASANIVRLLEVYPNPRDGTISVCLEYMDGGSLQDVVRAGGCQDELVLAGIARQILSGVAFLHSKRHLHRDIKPGNILLHSGRGDPAAQQGNSVPHHSVKLSDFGLAKELESGHSLADSFLGTFHYMSPERISGGDYSFPSDIWGVGMTVLALAMGRFPFAVSSSPRATEPGEGEGGYWAILQSIQERPSVGTLLASTRKHCEGHIHSYSAIFPPTHTKQHRFSHELHSFLSMALHRDHKQRPSAHTLLTFPFLQYPSSEDRQKVIAATEEFVTQCCTRNSQQQEARAASARQRTAKFSARLTARVSTLSRGMEETLSGGRTADKNIQTRRRVAGRSATEALQSGGPTGGQPREAVNGVTADGDGEHAQFSGKCGSSSVQKEGMIHLKKIVNAYRDYMTRAWRGVSKDNIDKAVLNTIWPLMDAATMTSLALNLDTPLGAVKKAFKELVVQIREKIEKGTLDQLADGGGDVREEGRDGSGVGIMTEKVRSRNKLLDKEFPEAMTKKRRAVAGDAQRGGGASISNTHLSPNKPIPNTETVDSIVVSEDVLDGSGSIDNDTFSVAELRALVTSSGGQFPQRPDTYRSTGSLTHRSNLATSLESDRETHSDSDDDGYGHGEMHTSISADTHRRSSSGGEDDEVVLSLPGGNGKSGSNGKMSRGIIGNIKTKDDLITQANGKSESKVREQSVFGTKSNSYHDKDGTDDDDDDDADTVQEDACLLDKHAPHDSLDRLSVGITGSVDSVPEDIDQCGGSVKSVVKADVLEESADYNSMVEDDDFESVGDPHESHNDFDQHCGEEDPQEEEPEIVLTAREYYRSEAVDSRHPQIKSPRTRTRDDGSDGSDNDNSYDEGEDYEEDFEA